MTVLFKNPTLYRVLSHGFRPCHANIDMLCLKMVIFRPIGKIR